ncbi:MAG: ABC transporter ATP-binding protein [Candidatus Undinarchaeales archaeon]|jgi:ABC-type Fe3+/spermidine/putrescine transport system ATPase subunit|nr:ABC transporter ATP-binding protein [Candidatus Undinarchaeales archaeon]
MASNPVEKVDACSISVNGISKSYGDKTVVNDISLDVKKGEFLVILGPSGCGKTTLLRMIGGLEKQTSGDILFDDENMSGIPPQNRDIGFLFQHYTLFTHLNVRENVEFGLKIRKVKKAERNKRVLEMLDLMGLSDMITRDPNNLSGGQKQRIAMARALVLKPSVLLLDEAFGALDASTRSRMRQDVKEIQKKLGITTILVTHDQEEAFELGDRVAVMNNGKIEHLGTPQEIYEDPQSAFVAQFIGTVNVLNGVAEKNKVKLGYLLLDMPKTKYTFKSGETVKVLVRPEDVEVEKALSKMKGKDEITTGKILSLLFLGPFVKMRISLGRGITVRVLKPKTEVLKKNFKEGDNVFVNLENYKAFPESADAYITAPVAGFLKV